MNRIFKVVTLCTFALGLAGCSTWSSGRVTPAAGAPAPASTQPPATEQSAAKPERSKPQSAQRQNTRRNTRQKFDPAVVAAIIVTENDITDRPYDVVGDIKVTVNKTTIFNKDPTREQVDDRLREEAAKVGANAVILVRYGTVGIGLMSWGSLDGQGRAVKFK
ncbi:MAG TPA: hypothetical protein VJ750_06175 [Rhizomicrobium sp.]|nr:hypothetical protein [Rhizomicrobium sp.]